MRKYWPHFCPCSLQGERFSHLSWWSHGSEAIKKGFGVDWLPKASSTLTRFWGKVYTQSLSEKLAIAARQLAITIIGWQGIAEDTFNIDSSVLIRSGRQDGARSEADPHTILYSPFWALAR